MFLKMLSQLLSCSKKVDHYRVSESDVLIFHNRDDLEPELEADHVGPSDERSLVTSESEPSEQKSPPTDKFNFVYIICYLLGTCTLLPWYFFITCTDYWMYRFRDLHNSTVTRSFSLILPNGQDGRDKLQADFMSYLSIASTIPSTIFLFFTIFFVKRFSLHGQVVLSFMVLLALFVETTILILFNTDKWQWYFFIITLTTVVLLNITTALLQVALCGIVTRFPVCYISAFSSGQSLAGIVAAVFRVGSLCVSVTPSTSTFMYFTFADVVILIAFFGYFGARTTEFFKFHMSPNPESTYRRRGSDNESILRTVNYRDLQMRIGYPCASLFLCFVITTCVYPSVVVLVVPSSVPLISPFYEFFVPVVTYLLYSVCEYSGRVLAGLIQKPKGCYAFCFSASRFILIPLIMVCNVQPRSHLPVLVESDWIYGIIIVVLALTNGYLANLSFILMPKSVYSHEYEVASSILVIWLALGLSVGSLMSFPLINLL